MREIKFRSAAICKGAAGTATQRDQSRAEGPALLQPGLRARGSGLGAQGSGLRTSGASHEDRHLSRSPSTSPRRADVERVRGPRRSLGRGGECGVRAGGAGGAGAGARAEGRGAVAPRQWPGLAAPHARVAAAARRPARMFRARSVRVRHAPRPERLECERGGFSV
ncbi:unnamed protein product, partial [Iphiclides podalirius]